MVTNAADASATAGREPSVEPASLQMPDSMPVIFADGVSNVNFGMPNSKITFHTLLTPPGMTADGIEQRRAVLQLNLPTHILLDMCKKMMAGVVANRKEITRNAEKFASSLDALISQPPLSQPTPQSAPEKRRHNTKVRGNEDKQ